MFIYIYIVMSVMEEISRMSKSGCGDKELLDYIYMIIMMSLNVNLMEMSVRNSKSTIVIFALTATGK